MSNSAACATGPPEHVLGLPSQGVPARRKRYLVVTASMPPRLPPYSVGASSLKRMRSTPSSKECVVKRNIPTSLVFSTCSPLHGQAS